MEKLNLQIYEASNGYIISKGSWNNGSQGPNYVADSIKSLATLVEQLATESKYANQEADREKYKDAQGSGSK